MVDVSTDSTSDHVVLSVSGFGFCVGLDGVSAVTFCANSHIAVLLAHGSTPAISSMATAPTPVTSLNARDLARVSAMATKMK